MFACCQRALHVEYKDSRRVLSALSSKGQRDKETEFFSDSPSARTSKAATIRNPHNSGKVPNEFTLSNNANEYSIFSHGERSTSTSTSISTSTSRQQTWKLYSRLKIWTESPEAGRMPSHRYNTRRSTKPVSYYDGDSSSDYEPDEESTSSTHHDFQSVNIKSRASSSDCYVPAAGTKQDPPAHSNFHALQTQSPFPLKASDHYHQTYIPQSPHPHIHMPQ
jgi:hypothetical protein